MRKAITFLIVLASSAIWFLLAIWGAGGFDAFFALPSRIALAAVTFLLVVASSFTQGNISKGEKEDRANRWVLFAFLAIGLVDGFLPAYCDARNILTFGGEGVRFFGVALNALGGALRLWPVFVLGRRFSGLVAIQKEHRLVTEGIYKRIRNPSYLGALVLMAGWALAFRSLVGLLLAAFFIPPLIARIKSEERLLKEHFGAEYDIYRSHSWRMVPYVY